MTKYTKWAEPVTYGSSKFGVMTDELHARPVAVVNKLDDARLIAAAPELLAALDRARSYLRGKNFDAGLRDAVASDIEAAIYKATGSKP